MHAVYSLKRDRTVLVPDKDTEQGKQHGVTHGTHTGYAPEESEERERGMTLR